MNYLGSVILALFFLLLLRKRARRVRLIRELGHDPGTGVESFRWINAATILTGLTFLLALTVEFIRGTS
jgi:hypothetical protein